MDEDRDQDRSRARGRRNRPKCVHEPSSRMTCLQARATFGGALTHLRQRGALGPKDSAPALGRQLPAHRHDELSRPSEQLTRLCGHGGDV